MRCQTIKRKIAFDLITPHTIERTTVSPYESYLTYQKVTTALSSESERLSGV